MARPGIAVGKSGAVIHARGRKGLPGQSRIESRVYRVSLVVIELETARRGTEIGQAAIDRAKTVGRLIRIGEMKLADTTNFWRTDGQLIALDQRTIDGERQEGIRVPDVVVIEEVLGQRMKVIGIDGPALNGDRDPKLIFLVAFTMQRNETQIAVLRELEQGTLKRGQRRCLVVLPPESTQNPVQPRKPQGRAETRAGGVLHDGAGEMRLTHPAGEAQPVRRPVRVLDVGGDQRPGGIQRLIDVWIAGGMAYIVEEHDE